MQFDWTTFALEIVNFLVLVWLLKRFFYKPVRTAIEARRQAIEQTLQAAEATRTEAAGIKTEYEHRLNDWQIEKRKMQQALQQELSAERERRLAALDAELSQQREKARLLAEREAQAREAHLAREAQAHAGQFAAKLLERVACPPLQEQLINMLMSDLQTPGNGLDFEKLRGAWRSAASVPAVVTAYPLDEPTRRALVQAMEKTLGTPHLPPEFRVEPQLLAGVQLQLGALALDANLRSELRFFQDSWHAD